MYYICKSTTHTLKGRHLPARTFCGKEIQNMPKQEKYTTEQIAEFKKRTAEYRKCTMTVLELRDRLNEFIERGTGMLWSTCRTTAAGRIICRGTALSSG